MPTFGLFTESKESLAELEATVLKILSSQRYSKKDILNGSDFVMVDSTSHNLVAIESVCKKFKVNNIPRTPLCKIHPLMMLRGKIKYFVRRGMTLWIKKELVNVTLLMWISGISH